MGKRRAPLSGRAVAARDAEPGAISSRSPRLEARRTAIQTINGGLARRNTSFKELSEADQDAYLHGLEHGGEDLDGVPSEIFFQMLLQMSVEGYFADPVYGGNKDMLAWKMIRLSGGLCGLLRSRRQARREARARADEHRFGSAGQGARASGDSSVVLR